MKITKQIIIDPPSGWKYGFPKPIPEDRQKDTNVWLVEQEYPQAEIDSLGDHFACRYWNTTTVDMPYMDKHVRFENVSQEQLNCLIALYNATLSQERKGS